MKHGDWDGRLEIIPHRKTIILLSKRCGVGNVCRAHGQVVPTADAVKFGRESKKAMVVGAWAVRLTRARQVTLVSKPDPLPMSLRAAAWLSSGCTQ